MAAPQGAHDGQGARNGDIPWVRGIIPRVFSLP